MANKAYKQHINGTTGLSRYEITEGETLEQAIERRMENKEPLEGEAPLIYTDRKEGVLAGYNIRSDRFEIALDGITAIQKSKTAKRDHLAKMEVIKNDEKTEDKTPGQTPGKTAEN